MAAAAGPGPPICAASAAARLGETAAGRGGDAAKDR